MPVEIAPFPVTEFMAPRSRRSSSANTQTEAAAHTPVHSAAGSDSLSVEERIYASITSALLQGRLRPGAQLVERDLAAAFGCTRGALRKVLARLGFEGKLVLEANRGAFVPSPSEEDIRQVYRARQIVEAGIVAALCGALSAAHKRRLRAHVRSEEKALRAGAIDESVRLAGQFHVLLTELAGGTELLGLVGQLVAKTELYKALFDPSKGSACSADEHAHIIDALDGGDLPAALAAMREHLSELEERVVEQVRKSAAGEDLGAVFGL
jgi:DNA-binding GntR family transcriptional regulator